MKKETRTGTSQSPSRAQARVRGAGCDALCSSLSERDSKCWGPSGFPLCGIWVAGNSHTGQPTTPTRRAVSYPSLTVFHAPLLTYLPAARCSKECGAALYLSFTSPETRERTCTHDQTGSRRRARTSLIRRHRTEQDTRHGHLPGPSRKPCPWAMGLALPRSRQSKTQKTDAILGGCFAGRRDVQPRP